MEQARDAAQRGYQAIVDRIAAGDESIDPAEVEAVVTDAGRTVEQLEEDADRERRRAAHQAAIKRRPDLVDRARGLRATVEGLQQQKREAVAEVSARFDELLRAKNSELTEVECGLEASDRALHELLAGSVRTEAEDALTDEKEELVMRLRSATLDDQPALRARIGELNQQLEQAALQRVLR